MTAIAEMDEITQDTIEDMLALTEAGAIDDRANQGYDDLDAVRTETSDERDYRDECKGKIAQAQFDIGADQRKNAYKALRKVTDNIAAASQLMNEAAADNILNKVTDVGNAAADTVKSVAATVEALGAELKKVGNGEGELDGAALSGKINDTLDKLNSLKNL